VLFTVYPASLQTFIDTLICVKTVFSIVRSTFGMCSVMAIFKSSVVWGLFEYTECFIAPQRKKNRTEKDPEILQAKWF